MQNTSLRAVIQKLPTDRVDDLAENEWLSRDGPA
jgi:hypothetical protein